MITRSGFIKTALLRDRVCRLEQELQAEKDAIAAALV